jgi:hypothetical protein
VAKKADEVTEVVTASLGTGVTEDERRRVAELLKGVDVIVRVGAGWLPEGKADPTPKVTPEDKIDILSAVESVRNGRRDGRENGDDN